MKMKLLTLDIHGWPLDCCSAAHVFRKFLTFRNISELIYKMHHYNVETVMHSAAENPN